ncbi:hypothetical protein EF903_01610 [Streptomyces sp. WAC05292]|uniref:hypothetical protein n=1 Tax=Streptomyces sp. WAC05292 TaxID=2487418 RepID=UPI000F744245|nr:hypothetical protein [Streptomyces sp. WAC05292]RSS97245.1 hypothetical protein EF903_01610 [Streptomyces sp. WAC05292]
MDYAYAVKKLPQPDDLAPEEPIETPPEPEPPQQDDARPWAGDLYDEGDETDPAQAFAAFSGQEGEQAWLDKAEDGTLTGWVRDETGQVWRYSDPDAWAIDVDDAAMAQTGGTGGAAGEQGAGPVEGEQPPTVPGAAPAPSPVDGAPPLEFGTADEVVPVAGEAAAEEPAAAAAEEESTEEDAAAEDEEDEEEPADGQGKKNKLPWS